MVTEAGSAESMLKTWSVLVAMSSRIRSPSIEPPNARPLAGDVEGEVVEPDERVERERRVRRAAQDQPDRVAGDARRAVRDVARERMRSHGRVPSVPVSITFSLSQTTLSWIATSLAPKISKAPPS